MGNQPQQEYDYSQYMGDAGQQVAQESHRLKDGSGGKDIWIAEAIGNFPKFSPKGPDQGSNTYVTDIIMAQAGEKHPMVVAGRIKPDAMVHICWVYIHRNLGAGQGWYICPARTYGKRCPACEERSRIMANAALTDEQVKKACEPFNTGKHPMGIYNVIQHTNPQYISWSEPVMWWPINNSFMEAILQTKAKSDAIMEGTGYINYFWPTAGDQGGRHIKFDVSKKGKYDEYLGHTFYKRQSPVPPHVLAQARCLSDFLYIGDETIPLAQRFDAFYEEIRIAVDIVAEGQAAAQDIAGAFQSGGIGYGGPPPGYMPPSEGFVPPSAPANPVPALFGTPPPQRGMFAECEPFGSKFDNFDECRTCSVRVDCGQCSQPVNPVPAPVATPASTACATAAPPPPAGYAPSPAPAPPAPPPGGPVPRRKV
jgi:hypothetical protein